jgi:hypothetical protein
MTATSASAYNADYYALDFDFDYDQPVAAAAGGTVLIAAEVDNYGVKVVLDHGGGFFSVYAHLHFVAAGIQQGARVAQGQTVGYADATGYSPGGTHLHFHMQRGLTAHRPEPMSGVPNFGPYGESVENGYGCGYYVVSPTWTSSPPFSSNVLADRSFEAGSVCDQPGCAWRRFDPPGGTTNRSRLTCCNPPYSGSWFLRFSSTQPGGSMYQDIGGIYPSAGDSYVFSLWMRSPGFNQCVLATLRLWGLGGGTNEPDATHLNVCSPNWTNVRVPLDAQSSNTFLRAQIYVEEKNKNLDIDYGEVIQVMHENASFESANFCDTCAWQRIHPSPHPPYDTNWSRIPDLNPNANASGEVFLRMNRTGGTGASSIYQDIPVVVSTGQVYAFKVWMRQGPPWPAPTLSGTLRLWALEGSPNESASYNFTLNSPYWSEFAVLLVVNAPHMKLRAEIYLTSPFNTSFDFDGTRVYRW